MINQFDSCFPTKDFQGTSDSLLHATKEASTHLLGEQGVFLTLSCPRSIPGTGRMRGAIQTTTQTSGQRLLRRLRLYSVQLQPSNLKQAVENSQTPTNSTEVSKPPSRQLPSTIFRPPFHSEGSSNQLRQVQQAKWQSLFFRGNASHHDSNSLTTPNLPPLPPLLLQDVNLQRQQAQRDQPQLPGEWM